ncbi:hypothetical protein F4814DRAFT_446000 [Daldinia grandis]|nr:hypothetical protein F4814DRAFT_446000 [Daldinia grandis]
MPSQLEILSRAFVTVDASSEDFREERLLPELTEKLSCEYTGGPEPVPLPRDLKIYNEETFSRVVHERILFSINRVLHDRPESPYIRHGIVYTLLNRATPDTALTAERFKRPDSALMNLVPGDIKLSIKFGSHTREEDPLHGKM